MNSQWKAIAATGLVMTTLLSGVVTGDAAQAREKGHRRHGSAKVEMNGGARSSGASIHANSLWGCNEGESGGEAVCEGELILGLEPGADANAVAAQLGLQLIDRIPSLNAVLFASSTSINLSNAIDAAESINGVKWADVNSVDFTSDPRRITISPRRITISATAGLLAANSQQAAAQQAAVDVNGAMSCAANDGAGATVAVIDTGLHLSHPMFAGHVAGAWNAFNQSGDVSDMGNGIDEGALNGADEGAGHGTHVAGIVMQVAPGAAIMPIKAIDDEGRGQAWVLAKAIAHAADNGADVINLSLGSTDRSQVIEAAVNAALSQNVFVAAAGGNTRDAANKVGLTEWPAAMGDVSGVAASDSVSGSATAGQLATFSSRYAKLDIAAPGVDIVSAFPNGAQGLNSDYASWSGTSMATPWVAGTAALVIADHPGTAADHIDDAMMAAADRLANTSSNPTKGLKELDAAGTVCGYHE